MSSQSDTVSAGGNGGGGAGSRYQTAAGVTSEIAPVAGTNGLGGGGGGGSHPTAGGTGGNGTVIVRIPSSLTVSTTGSPTSNPDGAVSGYNIYEFGTGGGTFTIS
jgi:hypothetical protein